MTCLANIYVFFNPLTGGGHYWPQDIADAETLYSPESRGPGGDVEVNNSVGPDHDLRHETTSSKLFEKGFDTMEVRTITDHKTLQMLARLHI